MLRKVVVRSWKSKRVFGGFSSCGVPRDGVGGVGVPVTPRFLHACEAAQPGALFFHEKSRAAFRVVPVCHPIVLFFRGHSRRLLCTSPIHVTCTYFFLVSLLQKRLFAVPRTNQGRFFVSKNLRRDTLLSLTFTDRMIS